VALILQIFDHLGDLPCHILQSRLGYPVVFLAPDLTHDPRILALTGSSRTPHPVMNGVLWDRWTLRACPRRLFEEVSLPISLLDRTKLLAGLFLGYLAISFLCYHLFWGGPLRQEPAEDQRVDGVRVTLEDHVLWFWARLRPYISRDTLVGMALVIPAQLEAADDPREVVRGFETADIAQGFSPRDHSASGCSIGVLFWSNEEPDKARNYHYYALGSGFRRERWIRFPVPSGGMYADQLPRRYNATIWSGDGFWTITGIEAEKRLDMSFLRFFLVPAMLVLIFWPISLAMLVGIGIWWKFMRRSPQRKRIATTNSIGQQVREPPVTSRT
jgi:hypothetical protein